MNLPNTLPCRCTNPACGFTFHAPNPVAGSGTNIACFGNMTSCPRCGSVANYANWTTDSEGRFHLGGFFSFIRNIGDVSVLHSIKTELESADDGITAYELADILVEIEPGFGKFRDAIRSIPLGKVGNFLALLLTLISTIIAFQSMKLQEKSSEEDADFHIKRVRAIDLIAQMSEDPSSK